MPMCKVCGDLMSLKEKEHGICKECDAAISKVIVAKAGKGLYPRKVCLQH